MRNGLIIESNNEALAFYRNTASVVLPMTNFSVATDVNEALEKVDKKEFHLIIYCNSKLDDGVFDNIKKLTSKTTNSTLITINKCDTKSTLSKLFSSGAKGCILSSESKKETARLLSVLKYGIAPISPHVVDILTDKNATRTSRDSVQLTSRENDVFNLLCKGLTNKYIAKSLNLSVYTVADHVKSIFKKMNVHSRTALISQQLKMT